MEDSPVKQSVQCIGTYNAVKLADKYNVKVVLVSSDESARPTIMGATKRLAEFILETMQQKSKQVFSSSFWECFRF